MIVIGSFDVEISRDVKENMADNAEFIIAATDSNNEKNETDSNAFEVAHEVRTHYVRKKEFQCDSCGISMERQLSSFNFVKENLQPRAV